MSQNKIVLPIVIALGNNKQELMLELTPHNYQLEFQQFIKSLQLSNNQVLYLKHRVEEQLDRMALISKHSVIIHPKTQSSELIDKESDMRVRDINEISELVIRQEEGVEIDSLARFQQNRSKDKNDDKYEVASYWSVFSQNLERPEGQNSEFRRQKEQYIQTPNFQVPNHQDEQDIMVRQLPIKYQQNHQHNNENLYIPSPSQMESHQLSHFTPSQVNKSREITFSGQRFHPKMVNERKCLFLEDYQRQHGPSTIKKQPILTREGVEKSYCQPAHKKNAGETCTHKKFEKQSERRNQIINPIYKQLYENKTEAFMAKSAQQINSKEIQSFNQQQEYLLKKHQRQQYRPGPWNQDLSKKTTASFRRKHEPEDSEQSISRTPPQRAYRRVREPYQRPVRNYKCEAEKYREKMMKKQLESKEIGEKLKDETIERKIIEKGSVSPASKSLHRSRKCACCDNQCTKPRKMQYKVSRSPSQTNQTNKKYVSRLLRETFDQFQKQLRQY